MTKNCTSMKDSILMSFRQFDLIYLSLCVVFLFILGTLEGSTTEINVHTTRDEGKYEKSCGQRSLIEIINYLGGDIAFNDIKGAAPISKLGSNLAQLKRIFEAYGLNTLGVKVDGDTLFKMKTPAILHVNGNHFIALLPDANGRSSTVVDGLSHFQVTSFGDLNRRWKWEGKCLFVSREKIVLPELSSGMNGELSYYLKCSVIVAVLLGGIILIWKGHFLIVFSRKKTKPFSCLFLMAPILLMNTISYVDQAVINASEVDGPCISVKKPVYDFGLIFSETEFIEHAFEIENIGKKDLVIKDIKNDCSCQVSKKDKDSIKPGESMSLTVRRNFRGFGRVDAKVLVKTNDIKAPNTILFIRGERRKDFEIEPTRIQFGRVNKGTRIIILVRVLSGKGDMKLVTDKVKVSSPFLEVTEICNKITPTVDKRRLYIYKISILPSAPLGPINENIAIPCLNSSQKFLEIPVQAYVEGSIKLSLYRLEYGLVLVKGGKISKSVKISCATDFEVVGIHSNYHWLKCHCEDITKNNLKLVATIDPSKMKKGVSEGMITIQTNMEGMEQIYVPVRAYCLEVN